MCCERHDIVSVAQLQGGGDGPVLITECLNRIVEHEVDVLRIAHASHVCAELQRWVGEGTCSLSKLNLWCIARHEVDADGLACALAVIYSLKYDSVRTRL